MTLVLNEIRKVRIEFGRFNLAEDQRIIDELITFIRQNRLNSKSNDLLPKNQGDCHVYEQSHTDAESAKIEEWLEKKGIFRQKKI